jgi:glycine zipper 2TM protein
MADISSLAGDRPLKISTSPNRPSSTVTRLASVGAAVALTLLAAACGQKESAVDNDATAQAALDQRERELALREAEVNLKEREEALARRETSLGAQTDAKDVAKAKEPMPSTKVPPKKVAKARPVAPEAKPTPVVSLPPPPPPPPPIMVPSGTQLTLALDSDLSSKTAQPGDPVEGKVANSIVIDGRVAVPAGSRVSGTVTDVISGSHKIGGIPTLGLAFDSIQLPDGQRVKIDGDLVEHGASERGQDSAKILGGAAAGAVLGHQVKNNNGGKILGGLLGGAIGAIAAQKTGTEVQIAAGTELTISLGQSFQVKGR